MAVRVTRAGVGLTIGIIILALVVLGGLYLVKQRGEQARRDDAIQVAQENLESQSETGVITPSIDGEGDTKEQTKDESRPESESESESTTSNNQAETNGAEEVQEQGEVSELPATGANDVYGLFVMGLLAFAGASYVASRRSLLEL